MTDIAPLVAELRGLLAKVDPAILGTKPPRIAQMLRDGAKAQFPKPDNIDSHDFETDAALIMAAINALPTLLDALTNSAGIEEGDTKESYWLDEVLRRNGPCPTCGTIGMLGTVEDKLATPGGSGTDEKVELESIIRKAINRALNAAYNPAMDHKPEYRAMEKKAAIHEAAAALSARSREATLQEARAAYQAYCDVHGIVPEWGRGGFKTQILEWQAIAHAVLSARPGEVPLEQKPVVHHLGVALQNVADYHADVLNPREIKALYAAAALLWDDPRAALEEAGR